MAVTYALAADITLKAGANVHATALGAPALLDFGMMAESDINVKSGYNWTAWYAAEAATYPQTAWLLIETAACKAAIDVINYDMSGFTNIQEAVARINTLYETYKQNIITLKEQGAKDKLKTGGGSYP